MRERVLAIVSLIAQFVLEEREFLSETEMVEELLAEGFDAEEIDAAFSWMDNLSLAPQASSVASLSDSSHRVFTTEESRVLSPEGCSFLIRLRTMGILDDELHEEVVFRAVSEGEGEISLKDLKTLTAMTIFAHTHSKWRREVDCIFQDDWTRLYH